MERSNHSEDRFPRQMNHDPNLQGSPFGTPPPHRRCSRAREEPLGMVHPSTPSTSIMVLQQSFRFRRHRLVNNVFAMYAYEALSTPFCSSVDWSRQGINRLTGMLGSTASLPA